LREVVVGNRFGIAGEQVILQGDEVIEEVGAEPAVRQEAARAAAGSVGANDLDGQRHAFGDLGLGDAGVALVGDAGHDAVGVGGQLEGFLVAAGAAKQVVPWNRVLARATASLRSCVTSMA